MILSIYNSVNNIKNTHFFWERLLVLLYLGL